MTSWLLGGTRSRTAVVLITHRPNAIESYGSKRSSPFLSKKRRDGFVCPEKLWLGGRTKLERVAEEKRWGV